MAKTRGQYHVVAFDPGYVGTGWAAFSLSKLAFVRPETKVLAHLHWWSTGTFTGSEREMLRACVDLARRAKYGGINSMPFNADTDVVSEDFDLVQTLGGKELLAPVRINAVLEWELRSTGIAFHLQNRSMRTNMTKERLNRWGFQHTDKDSLAALQHGVTWLKRIKKESIRKPWKLSEEERRDLFRR